MLVAKFAALASLLAVALATPVSRPLVLHERISSSPSGFVRSHAAPATEQVTLRIALKQSNQAGLEDRLLAVSTPGNALYGQHLSKEEVEAFVRPAPEVSSAVTSWLQENGLEATAISPAGDWLSVTLPVKQANALFAADLSVFTHTETGSTGIRSLSYSIPAELTSAIELVHPMTSFWNPFTPGPKFTVTGGGVPQIAKRVAEPPANFEKRQVPASCATTVTPACIQALYQVPTTKATQSSSVLGVSGFIGQFANQADLTQFLKAFRADEANATFSTQLLDGGSNSQTRSQAGIEANLDIQYTIGLATGVPTTFISVGNNFKDGALEGFLDIINALLAESNPPHVLTTSYGQNENTISRALANQLCSAYTQLGARGTSILFASGDGGVSGSQSARCTTFVPTFPSGCPFMTSVGATQGTSPEVAASFSSGGFSNYFGIPSYQAAAVSAFKTKLGTTNSGKFNNTGRGFPDVSAQGVNLQIVLDTQTGGVDGTSCSSPVFASIVSLINDQLVAAGKSPLGFLNPFLYGAAASTFTDVTSGSNPGCNTNGFSAVAGWDPVTGLGTPNFPKLLAAAKTAAGL